MDSAMEVDQNELQQILNELKIEEQKLENINIAQKQLEDISVICFTKNIESVIDKLFHVSVKICDSVSDLEALDICHESYSQNFDSKTCLYVIKIFVSNVFQSRLINADWIANISIKNSDNILYRTVHLENLMPSNVIDVIMPYPKSIEPVLVETLLFLPSDENYWSSIKVSTIVTNISYHFIPLYEHKTLKTEHIDPLYQISKLYTDEALLKTKKPILKYKYSCNLNTRQLFEMILKNCVHKLNIDHLQILTNSDDVSNLHLLVNNSESAVKLDTKNNTLEISGNYSNMYAIKEVFTANIEEESKEATEKRKGVTVKTSFLQQLQALRMRLHEERSQKIINFDNLKMLYEEYKNLVANLPI